MADSNSQSELSYGERYRARWKWSFIVVGLLVLVAQLVSGDDLSVANLVGAFLVAGLVFGSVVNLAVAALPSGRGRA